MTRAALLLTMALAGTVAFIVGVILLFSGFQWGLLLALLGATAAIMGWVFRRR